MSPKTRPRVIADSDDENDESFSTPASPQAEPTAPVQAAAEGTAVSSGDPSHATSSTDLTFFQTVYNEQNDAALEEAHRVQFPQGSPGEGGVGLGGGLAESGAQSPLKPAMDDSIWDIPSSGEMFKDPTPAFKVVISQGGNHQHQSRGFEYGNTQYVDHFNEPRHEDGTSRRKKRRKAELSSRCHQDSDGIDLIPLFSSNGMEMGPPDQTSPGKHDLGRVPDSQRLLVSPRPLTDSQKLTYQSMEPPSSAMTEQIQHFPGQTYQLKLASSGSATNINTPRSVRASDNLPLPSTAPWSQDTVPASRQEAPRSARTRRNSSPDVISMPAPSLRSSGDEHNGPSIKEPLPSTRNPEEVADEDSMVGNGSDAHKEPVLEEQASVATMPEPTQGGKRKRGRPKKVATAELEPIPVADCTQGIEEKTPPKGKKKRGRPKKQSRPDAEDADQQSPNQEDIAAERNNVEKPVAQNGGDEEVDVADEKMEPDPAPPDAAASGHASPGTPDKSPVDKDEEEEEQEDEGKETPTGGKQETKLTRPQPKGGKAATTSTPGPKPLFRVGLSKKSNVAPLLKFIRK